MTTASPTLIVNLHTDPYDVYIGREGHGEDGFFGNPFPLNPGESRGATIARYEEYFLRRVAEKPEFRRRVLELRGRTLGCFCTPPGRPLRGDAPPILCHGQVIARWVDAQVPDASLGPTPPVPVRTVAVVGSRDFARLDLVEDFVASLPGGTVVVSGGARGVDRTAEEAARRRGLPVRVIRADWQRYGRSAGIRRNPLVVQASMEVHAFWDGRSPGTRDAVRCGLRFGRPVTIHAPDGTTRAP